MLRTIRKAFASGFAKLAEWSPNRAGPRPPRVDNIKMGSLARARRGQSGGPITLASDKLA